MSIVPVEIKYPIRGLNRALTLSEQPDQTSRDLLNTVGEDPDNKRFRGAQRSGMFDYLDTPAAAAARIRAMVDVVVDEHRIQYGYVTDPVASWTQETPGSLSSSIVRVDARGDVYWLDGDRGWFKTNSAGVVLHKEPIVWSSNLASNASYVITGFCIDDEGSVYASTGEYTGTLGATVTDNSRIWKWRIADDGDGYVLAWEYNTVGYLVADLKVVDGVLYTVQNDWASASGSRSFRLVWYDDIFGDQPPTADDTEHRAVVARADIFTTENVYARSFDVRQAVAGLEFIVCGTDNLSTSTTNESRFLAKVTPAGGTTTAGTATVVWKLQGGSGGSAYAAIAGIAGRGGIGYGVAYDSDGNVISLGQFGGTSPQVVWLRKFIDNGSTVTEGTGSTSSTTAWAKAETGLSIAFGWPRFALDSRDTIYAPFYAPSGSGTQKAVRVFDTTGAELTGAALDSGNASANRLCRSTAIPPSGAIHEPAFREDDQKIAEFVYCAALKASGVPATQKRHLLSITFSSGSPRTLKHVAAAPPYIQLFTHAGGFVTPTNGSTAFDSTARYVCLVGLYGKVFGTDGVGPYRYVEPRATVANANGIVREFLPTSSGTIPPRARLMFSWRGRLGLGRTPDDPHNFYLSATEDPFNWDFGPFVESMTDAMAGNLTPAGLIPDLPNCFFDWSDDVLIVGCDHSIWIVNGSPLRGGEVDKISSSVGMSFGQRACCMGPDGTVIFHDAGGIYAMSPGGKPDKISEGTIDDDLQDIDLSANYVEIAWDKRLGGLHVMVFAYGTLGGLRQHWFFEKKTKAWIPRRFGSLNNTDVQPTAMHVSDGDDPDDRRILLAGEDNHVGYFDPAAKDDRGTSIYNYALIGPIVPRQGIARQFRLVELEVRLAADRFGCYCEVYATNNPDVLGLPIATVALNPGLTRVRVRGRGEFLFLKLFKNKAGEDWAFESAVARVAPSGRVRA